MRRDKIKAWLTEVAKQAKQAPTSLPEGTELVVRSLINMLGVASGDELTNLKLSTPKENIGSLVIKLAEVSKFPKREWIDLINFYGLSLDLNPRDSARDVMGKLARHLRENPAALALVASKKPGVHAKRRTLKKRRPLAENLQDTLTRLLNE
ncbi:hypothetical protein NSND_60741 [Nitrospira sp. ND1]|nr:hypothetical protein NSND_60741 [Nitrospira sp. ND1]